MWCDGCGASGFSSIGRRPAHEIWYNPSTKRYTTIPNHPGDIPQGTLRAILSQAGITVAQFLAADA